MGQLKEGATYIYERDGDTVYARELGGTERRIIGMDYPVTDPINWHDVEMVAKTNPALQSALERAKLIYKLSKDKL